MNSIKRFVIFYFINLALLFFLALLLKGIYFFSSTNASIFLFPFFPLISAVLFGFIAMVIVNDDAKNGKIFTISHAVCSIAFLLLLIGMQISNWNHNRKYGNIEANKDYFLNTEYMDMTDYKISFDTLITRFSNPNDIRITGSIGDVMDTTIKNTKHKVRYVRLTYTKNNSTEEYKADFLVYNAKAHIYYYNIPLNNSDKKRIDAEQRKIKKLLDDILTSTEDGIMK